MVESPEFRRSALTGCDSYADIEHCSSGGAYHCDCGSQREPKGLGQARRRGTAKPPPKELEGVIGCVSVAPRFGGKAPELADAEWWRNKSASGAHLVPQQRGDLRCTGSPRFKCPGDDA